MLNQPPHVFGERFILGQDGEIIPTGTTHETFLAVRAIADHEHLNARLARVRAPMDTLIGNVLDTEFTCPDAQAAAYLEVARVGGPVLQFMTDLEASRTAAIAATAMLQGHSGLA